jgi:branched-chain amino acid aminotransferase
MTPARAGCISVNGRLFPPEQARVPALDAGFLLGDGLFESLRATDGVPYLLERHLGRMLAAASELEFANLPSPEELAEQVLSTLAHAGLPEAYVRLTVTRGTGGVGLAPPPGPPTVVVAVLPAQPLASANRGIAATLLASLFGPVAAKSTSWQGAVLARRLVEERGADEGLYVSVGEEVLEGVSSNVFAVVEGRLLTPSARKCLPGITRGRVLELAREHGAPVLEAPLALEVLEGATEVFVTNAAQGLRAITSLDGAARARPAAAGLFMELHRLYALDRAGARERVA